MKIRQARIEDIDKIFDLEKRVWKSNAATEQNITSRIKLFPKGSIVAEENGEIVGYVSGIIINQKLLETANTWYEFTDNGDGKSVFDPCGDVLFGISLTVDDRLRNKQVGSKLMLNIARMAIENNLEYGMLGGRLPYYYRFKDMPVDKYIKAKNESGHLLDPELRFYTRLGLKIIKVKENYFKDPESLDYGVILQWENPFYKITRYLPFLAKPLSYLFRI